MKMKKILNEKNINYIHILLFTIPFMSGLLDIWSISIFCILCFAGIIYKIYENKKIKLPKGKNLIFILIYVLSFLIVQFYAVDKGMNLLAFFKNVSILMFIILLMQYENKDKTKYFSVIPYSASASVIICIILMFWESSGVYFNDRLQGLFHYANSYALFLLIGVFVLINKEEFDIKDYIMFALMFIGIVLTNSRAIIILTIITMIISVFINKQNLSKKIIIIASFTILFGGIYLLSGIEKRVNPEMLKSSEFVTRLMYYSDGLQMVKNNPWGYGYEGWYYKQAEVQTGVYDTKFVHNSVLQIMLDVGIIPTISLFLMLCITFFDKKQNAFSRIIMILILGHSLIDIDLEYMYFVMLLTLFINFDEVTLNITHKYLTNSVLVLCGIWYFIIFLADANYASKNYIGATKIVPFHTEALQEILYSTTDTEMQLKYANKILKYNKNVSGAYEAISNKLVEEKKYIDALEFEEKMLNLNKYSMYNYIMYAQFLSDGINYFSENNQIENASLFLDKIIEIESKIIFVLDNTNELCYKTIHTPNLEMPEELKTFIMKAKNALE